MVKLFYLGCKIELLLLLVPGATVKHCADTVPHIFDMLNGTRESVRERESEGEGMREVCFRVIV